MPETAVANSQRSITLPNEVWEEIDKLAIMQPGELTRELIMRGLRAYKSELAAAMSYENKQLVNQKLKQRQGSMSQALKALQQSMDEVAPESLELHLEDMREAIAIIAKCLAD